MSYDHLVLACGRRVSLAAIPGMADHAVPLKTAGDMLYVRNLVLRRLARIGLWADPVRFRRVGPLELPKLFLRAFNLHDESRGGIQHPSRQRHLRGHAIDKRTEPDSLHRSAQGDAQALYGFGCWLHAPIEPKR